MRLAEAVRRVGRKAVARPDGDRRGAEDESVSQGGLSKILSGERSNPGIFTIKTIADAAGVTVGELLGERGFELTESNRAVAADAIRHLMAVLGLPFDARHERASYVADQSATDTDDFPPPPIHIAEWIERDTDVPRPHHEWRRPLDLEEAAAGPTRLTDDAVVPTGDAGLLNSLREIRDPRVKVVKIFGDSMDPVLHDGSKVLLDPSRALFQPGQIVMVYIKDEGSTIGLLAKNGEGFRIVKRNPDYGGPPEIVLHAGEWYPVGTVTTIVEAPVEIE